MRRIAIIVTALAALGAGLVVSPTAVAADGDWRWYDGSKTVCVDITRVDSSAVRSAVKEVVNDIRDHTNRKLTIRGSDTCYNLGYKYRILVYDGYYGSTGSCWYACTWFKGGFSWGKTKGGDWAQRLKSPVVVKINQSKWNGLSTGRRVSAVGHEILHGLGRDHTTRCDSIVQASMQKALSRGCKIYRNLTKYDRYRVDWIYRNG